MVLPKLKCPNWSARTSFCKRLLQEYAAAVGTRYPLSDNEIEQNLRIPERRQSSCHSTCHYMVQVFVLRSQEHEEYEVWSVDIRLSFVNELLRLIKALRTGNAITCSGMNSKHASLVPRICSWGVWQRNKQKNLDSLSLTTYSNKSTWVTWQRIL
jgi:hypothetical protein